MNKTLSWLIVRQGAIRQATSQHQGAVVRRILDDASEKPVVMAAMPNLKGLLGDGGCPLLVLPQGVKLWMEKTKNRSN